MAIKRFSKILFAAGGALLLGGAVANYLLGSQRPITAQEELTLANLEAMAFMDPDDPDNPDKWDPNEPGPGSALMICGTVTYLVCKAPCPICGAEFVSPTLGGPFKMFISGKCQCGAILH